MGNTIYTIFLFGLPLLVCFLLWHAFMALIKRFWPQVASIEKPGCLNLFIFIALGAAFFGMISAINDNFATIITVKRADDGEIKKFRKHYFAPGMKIDGEPVSPTRLTNDCDRPLYIYSTTYGKADPNIMSPEVATYTVACAPGQSIPVLMHIDYYFKPAPESVKVKDGAEVQMRWVLDTVVPFDYVIPIAPNAPIIVNSENK